MREGGLLVAEQEDRHGRRSNAPTSQQFRIIWIRMYESVVKKKYPITIVL